MPELRNLEERTHATAGGVGMLLLAFLLVLAAAASFITGVWIAKHSGPTLTALPLIVGGPVLLVSAIMTFGGLFTVQPNQAVALTLFGRYVGSTRTEGLRWANPFLSKKKISLRVRNFDSDKLKVNELEGSPVEVAAIVVWRVVDSAQALFSVDDYAEFVHIQAESAIRQMATSYPYDGHDDPAKVALRSHADEISARLQHEIQSRLETAGVNVIEARISHLAYAPEIAAAMLQRQQAGAVIAARARIVEGAVSMVDSALEQLSAKGVIEIDPERRAQLAGNLLVVLCGDRNAQPVINTGSMY